MYPCRPLSGLTDARGDGRAALLVALAAPVTHDAYHAVFAGTLARRLVAGLAQGAHWMAVACCGNQKDESP